MKKDRNPSLDVVMTEEMRDSLEMLAKERSVGLPNKVYASDIVREAIEEYLEQRGYPLKSKIFRGGRRPDGED